jgi:ubiquinone/menaquinone biosynthesis C-methylase UbiE
VPITEILTDLDCPDQQRGRKMTFQLVGDGPEIYERTLVPLWFGRWAETLMAVLQLQPGERVLDVACGTGVTTRHAKEKVGPDGHVDGLDINPAMLARAAELADGLGIGWIACDVTDSRLPSGHYDVILSQHGYHYFPDKPAALEEFRRLLVPGGRVALSTWERHSPYTLALCAAVEKHISADVARTQRSQRETPSADELMTQVRDAGFANVTVQRQELVIDVPLAEEFVPMHLGSMPIAGAFEALDDDGKRALVEHVAAALAGHVEGERLVYTDAVNVVMGET